MDLEEFAQKFSELGDRLLGARAGKHWSNGAAAKPIRPKQPRAYPFDLGTLGPEDQLWISETARLEQSALQFEQQLRENDKFVLGISRIEGVKIHVQMIIKIDRHTRLIGRTPVLEWNAHHDRSVIIQQNRGQMHSMQPVPGTEEKRIITRNAYWWFEIDRPLEQTPKYDRIAIFG